MDRIRFKLKQQTKLEANHSRKQFQFHRALFRTRSSDPHNNTKRNHRPKCHRINVNILKLISALSLSTCIPVYATDVGGVSATANPVANSSGFSYQPGNTSFTRTVYNKHIWRWHTMPRCYRQLHTIHHQNRNMARSLRGHLSRSCIQQCR